MASDKMRKDRKRGQSKSPDGLTQADIMNRMLSGDVDIPDPSAFNNSHLISTGIVKHDDGALEISNIRIHRKGLEFLGTVTEDEYELFGDTLLQINTAFQWIIGDFLSYGVASNYGMAQDFAQRLGIKSETINNWSWVCQQVEFSFRNENLSFTHHYHVASLPPQEQKRLLTLADENGWSVSRLKKEIEGDVIIQKSSKILERILNMSNVLTDKKFNNLSVEEQEILEKYLTDMLKKVRQWRQKNNS